MIPIILLLLLYYCSRKKDEIGVFLYVFCRVFFFFSDCKVGFNQGAGVWKEGTSNPARRNRQSVRQRLVPKLFCEGSVTLHF